MVVGAVVAGMGSADVPNNDAGPQPAKPEHGTDCEGDQYPLPGARCGHR